MGVFLGISYILFVFGPSLTFFFMVVNTKPELKLVAISSAFVWLISIMPPSLLQLLPSGALSNLSLIPLILLFSTFCQEAARFLFASTYLSSERSVLHKAHISPDKSPYSDFSTSLSSGLGFGIFYALVMQSGVISAAFAQPAHSDFFLQDDQNLSLYLASAIMALSFQVLHIGLAVITFAALRRYVESHNHLYKYFGFSTVFLLHLLTSLATALNTVDNGAKLAIPLAIAVVMFTTVIAYKIVSRADYVGARV